MLNIPPHVQESLECIFITSDDLIWVKNMLKKVVRKTNSSTSLDILFGYLPYTYKDRIYNLLFKKDFIKLLKQIEDTLSIKRDILDFPQDKYEDIHKKLRIKCLVVKEDKNKYKKIEKVRQLRLSTFDLVEGTAYFYYIV